MADPLKAFQESMESRRWMRGRGRLLVAISGGLDSMVLLDLLVRMIRDARRRLVVGHFNHRLRGRSSDADERLVRRIAAEHRLRCIVGGGDVRARAAREGQSIEMAARAARHEFLAAAAKKAGARRIVLAHHADDQVELFFVRLLRGASAAGLGGMANEGVSPADRGLRLLRPLLGLTKADLRWYADANRIEWREDASNLSEDPLRNRIRLELLPLLRRRYQPALNAVILRTMEMLAAESALAHEQAADWLAMRRRAAFDELPTAVQRAVLAVQMTGHGSGPAFERIEALRERAGLKIQVTPGKWIERGADGIIRTSPPVKTASPVEAAMVIDVSRAGVAEFGSLKVRWHRRRVRDWRRFLERREEGCELFDAAKLGTKVTLRQWRTGDRFHAFGMPGATKLQDWFVNRKVPRARRHELVLAEAAGGMLCWVEGQRLADPFKLDDGTREVLVWRWKRNV